MNIKLRTTPNPVLVAARKEIHAILKKHDIAGIVLLSSKDAMEHLFEIEASWNCMRIVSDPKNSDGVLVRVNTTNLPADTKKETLEATIGTILGFSDLLTIQQRNCRTLMECIGRHVGEIEHITGSIPDSEV